MIAHRGRERERLAAAPGAEVDHLVAWPGARDHGGELRALVLDLDLALEEGRIRLDGGRLLAGAMDDPQADRRVGRRRGREVGELCLDELPRALQGIDAQIERGTFRESCRLRGEFGAEEPFQRGRKPFGEIARDMRGGIVEAPGIEAPPLDVAQGRRREALSGAEAGNLLGGQASLQPQHTQQDAARIVIAHEPSRGGPATERVVDQAGDRGTIARPGEAVRQSPILQGVRRRPPTGRDVSEDLHGRGEACRRRHRAPPGKRSVTIRAQNVSPVRRERSQRACRASGENCLMTTLLRLSVAAALTFTIAACASAPPPPPDYPPPGQRQLDAKTQLESGRRY